jgi:hypothetical protein
LLLKRTGARKAADSAMMRRPVSGTGIRMIAEG